MATRRDGGIMWLQLELLHTEALKRAGASKDREETTAYLSVANCLHHALEQMPPDPDAGERIKQHLTYIP